MTSEKSVEEVLPEEKKFTDFQFHPELQEKIAANGFVTPTPVQAESIPFALAGRDVVLQAQTGTGKTLAFVLPVVQKLMQLNKEPRKGHPLALVLTPTRELSQQVSGVVASIAPEMNVVELIGGVPIQKQKKKLETGVHIAVGTPGRILDCLRQRILFFKSCGFFVLDEVDEMFSMGFYEDVRAILSRLPKERQGTFASATVTPRVTMLARSFLEKPEHIFIDEEGEDLPPIEHLVCTVDGGVTDKLTALCDIIETRRPRSAIVFCNTKSDTELVEGFLRRRGFDARRLNSDLPQKKRELVMKKMRDEELQILVATDIAARGLDIEQIELVVNYAIHDESELYLHRTGRTGRAGRSGMALNLVGPQDFMAFKKISREVEVDFEDIAIPTDEEVADARLTHFYQLLQERRGRVTDRERLMSRKFLRETVGADDPDDAVIDLIAFWQKHFVENALRADTRSLDEELGGSGDDSERKESSHDRSSRSGRGGRSRDRRGGNRRGGGRQGGSRRDGRGRSRD